MTQREAQNARHKIGLKKESSYHSGYDGPLGLAGAKALVLCLRGHPNLFWSGTGLLPHRAQ